MLVHGAIVPPRATLEAVAAVVRSVPEPPPAPPSTEQSKGLLGRLGRRKDEVAPPPSAPMLEHVPSGRMQLPITGFGNVTTADAERLVNAIETAADGWPAPQVWFSGGTALDFPGDWSVWAKLGGDLDALGEVARGVIASVEALGFYVDRRAFRPMVSVATVTPATTGPFLQQVVDSLDDFRGESWIADVVLQKESFVGETAEWVDFHRIALG
jgi:hypothetical protein